MSLTLVDYVDRLRQDPTAKKNSEMVIKHVGDAHSNHHTDSHNKARSSTNINAEKDKKRKSGSSARPGDVSELFSQHLRYFVSPAETTRRRSNIFLNASRFCSVDTTSKQIMFPRHADGFLRGPALIYFMGMVLSGSQNPEGAIQMLQSPFFEDREKRPNDD